MDLGFFELRVVQVYHLISLQVSNMSVRCDHTVEDVMFLLRRNWFFDRKSVYDLLDELPGDVYYEVLERRHELPPEVEDYFLIVDILPIKTVIRDISDAEWEEMRISKELDRYEKFKKRKNAFVAPPRPRESIDDLFDYAQSSLARKQQELDDMLRTSKYRNRKPGEHSMIEYTRSQVETLKNELEMVNSRLITCNKLWTELNFLDAVQLGAVKSSETS